LKTVARDPSETVEEFVRKHYTIQWVDGNERPERLERAKQAVKNANPRFDSILEVALPEIKDIPQLNMLIENANDVANALLSGLGKDPRLIGLSLIDPIRVGCEELGIALTPQVAADVRQRLSGNVSFDQARYEQLAEEGGKVPGLDEARWVREV
jgi:hypothetical protein